MTPIEFHPLVQTWFDRRFGEPTQAQHEGWPHIAAGRSTLIAAPTGSGKTLAAFLVCLDSLIRQAVAGELENEIQTVYLSPLRALSNDIERNLRQPLRELAILADEMGVDLPPIRTFVRTGDTTASQRAAMLRKPPHLLVTTPESLYLLLTSVRGRERLRSVRTVIVDEIHALARDKRGSHLALSLERLDAICPQKPVRIGLSATQRPLEQIAQFLVGMQPVEAAASTRPADKSSATPEPEVIAVAAETVEAPAAEMNGSLATEEQTDSSLCVLKTTTPQHGREYPSAGDMEPRACEIIDGGHMRDLDMAIVTPPSELQAVCSHEQWDEIYEKLVGLVESHRSTLVFVNTRKMAERVSFRLSEILGPDSVASHHGSLSKDLRHSAEERFKEGKLKAVVATSSLEMGIDIGYIDLVCQIGSPQAIAAFLQRVGRSGHSIGATPKGRLFPLTRDELIECMALVRSVRRGELDAIEIPEQPLDILAQQIVADVAAEERDEDDLFAMVKQAYPFRNLTPERFSEVLEMLAEGLAQGRGAYLHRDRINGRLRPRKGARLAAITSGGAIPEAAEYKVITADDRTTVGTLDEEYAFESHPGDVFLLGNTSWRIQYVRGGEVAVLDAGGQPPSVPFWFGEAPGRTIELSREVSKLRLDIANETSRQKPILSLGEGGQRLDECASPTASSPHPDPLPKGKEATRGALSPLFAECGVDANAAKQAGDYVHMQHLAVGVVPSCEEIVFERFFDDSGGMQLVIHAPFGQRINRAWGLAMRKRFCRSFDFELQAAANDNGVLLSLSPQHSFPIENLFTMLRTSNCRDLLEQALLAAPMFQVRWRWNVTRSLAVLRRWKGKKVPPHLQRYRSEDLLSAVFPETVGCLENHHGDVEVPNHPLVQQTMHDCLHEAMDFDRWYEIVAKMESGEIRLVPRDTREPSPFAHELINANPYAFLDDAPLEERRTRAVSTRRTLSSAAFTDLSRLDDGAIMQVRREAWPTVRDAEEAHDALLSLGVVHEHETANWGDWLDELVADGRAARVAQTVASPRNAEDEEEKPASSTRSFWMAAERIPEIEAIQPDATIEPPIELPEALQKTWTKADARKELVRGRISHSGPITSLELGEILGIEPAHVFSALEALEASGLVMRGCYTGNYSADQCKADKTLLEWCERRLLARIHRLTLSGLREQIKPVAPSDYLRFLLGEHGLADKTLGEGPVAVRDAIAKLEGFELAAGAWEASVLAARVTDYDTGSLDQLFAEGEIAWGRLCPPKREECLSGPGMTRTAPISIMLREDLPWLVPPKRESAPAELLREHAEEAAELLKQHGALFMQELLSLSRCLPTHLEEALRELASWGMVSCDGFAAVRAIVTKKKEGRFSRRPFHKQSAAMGRWSKFPPPLPELERRDYVDRWCRLLLRRYGVMFRDLLKRETAAPPWWELVMAYRLMELRGEIRGGRFVGGVGGEQFAEEWVIDKLRKTRSRPDDQKWKVLSAADPVCLFGVLTDEPRIPATHTNYVVVRDGRLIAARQGGKMKFFADLPPIEKAEIERALHQGGKHESNAHLARNRWNRVR